MHRRLQLATGFINPFWLRMVANKTLDGIVNSQGAIVIEGQLLVFKEAEQTLSPGTQVMVSVSDWITCTTLDEHLFKKDQRAQHQAEEDRLRQERHSANKQQAETFNAALNIPVRWSVGIKDVLSGLSEHSNGDGYSRSTVHHVVLEQELRAGKLKRDKGDFLCTSASRNNGKNWSGSKASALPDGNGGTYAPKVTCKACLTLSMRFQHLTPEP